jgi:hypothetical protein
VQASLYSAEVGAHTHPPTPIQILASPSEPWVLLGRDVLNTLRLVLDGPGQVLEIS